MSVTVAFGSQCAAGSRLQGKQRLLFTIAVSGMGFASKPGRGIEVKPRARHLWILGVALAVLCAPSFAAAEGVGSLPPSAWSVRYCSGGERLSPDQMERDLRRATKRIRGAGVGLGLSLAVIPVGAALIFAGVPGSLCFGGPCPDESRGTAMMAAGTMLVVGGVVGTVVSGALLAPARRERHRLESPARTEILLAPGGLTLTHRF